MAKTNKGRKLFATTATAALVASAIVPVASAAQVNDFNSISSYAQEAVQSLVDRGVVQGDAKGNFNPRNSVTRAEAATILVGALDLDATGSINFTDVKAGAWYYDAINAAVNNNVFQGQGAGKFNPSGNLTRSEAAIILVNAFGLEGTGDLSEFSDASSVKTWAKEALEIAVANGVMKGDNGKLNPNANITKQDFAVMFYRTEVLEAAPVTGAVKAINNTTVEVTFEEVVADVNALKFTIDGLEVTNAVVKQTDSKTVVLTTAAQTADTTYKVSVDGKEVGSFKGVSAVIPTAIKTVVASQQGVIGKEVTLSAEVTVAEGQSKAGIPVTFNIVNDKSTNGKIEVEAITDDKGVATYSYTRYYNGIDEVVAYATSKSSVKDNAKVYWASAAQLTIKEAKEGNTVANNSKKVYEITGEKNSVVFVAFEENLNVKSNKVVDVAVTSAAGYIDEKDDYYAYKSTKDLTPYELSTGDAQYVVIELDSKGKGSLIITGEDASVTPVVYQADYGKLNLKKLDEDQEDVAGLDVAYSKLLLQDKAATVKFDKNDTLQLEVKALGTEDAAQVQAETLPANGTAVKDIDNGLGGRKYEVTVKNKAGEVAAAGTTAYVAFQDIEGDVKAIINGKVQDIDTKKVYAITVEGKEGKASFRVIGQGKKAYVTPTVFLNTDGKTGADTELGKKDIQVEAETTYFTSATVKEAVIKVLNAPSGTEVASLQAGKKAYAVYQSVDQNGFAYGTGKKYDVTFELSTTFGELKVTGEDVHNVGRTYTYETTSDLNGKAVVEFTSDSSTTVDIDILGSRNVLPAKVATVKFTQYATGETTDVVADADTANDTLTIGTNVYSYADAKEYQEKGSKISKAAFETLLNNEYVRVAVTKDADGNLTFNVLEAGAAPVVPPVAGSLIEKAEVTSPTTIVVTFGEAVSFADASQFWFDLDKDGVVDTNETTLTSTGSSATTHTFTVASGTITSDIGKVVYTPALASANRLTKTTGSVVVSDTITLDDAKTTFAAVANNPLALAAATGTAATAGLGTNGTKQVEELTLAATAGLGAGTFTAQFVATGVTVAPITITTTLNESLPSVADRLVAALNNDTDFKAKYVASPAGAKVVITALTAAAEDAALNLSVTDVNTGITTVATSTLVGTPAVGTAAIATADVTAAATAASTFNKVAKVRVAQTSATLGNFDKTIEVPVTGTVTTAQTAAAIVAALNADTTFAARFTASVDTTVNTAVVVTNKETGVVTATVIEVAN